MTAEVINEREQSLPNEERRGRPGILTYRTLIWAVIIAGVITGLVLLPFRQWLVMLLEWTQGLGIWAYLLVTVFYVVSCIFLIPGSVITLGAGFLFQLVRGVITVSIASMIGACAAFWIGRTVARNWVDGKIARNEKFAAIDDAVAAQGLKIVLLTRLSPFFPFNLLNYAFGLTRISFWKYALGSWIGMIPGTVMYVYFGAGLRSFAELAKGDVEKGMPGGLFFWFGLAATVAVTVFVTRIARNALKQVVRSTDADTAKSEVN